MPSGRKDLEIIGIEEIDQVGESGRGSSNVSLCEWKLLTSNSRDNKAFYTLTR